MNDVPASAPPMAAPAVAAAAAPTPLITPASAFPLFDDETVQRRYKIIKSRLCLDNFYINNDTNNNKSSDTSSSASGGGSSNDDGEDQQQQQQQGTIDKDDADAIFWLLAEGAGVHDLPLDDDDGGDDQDDDVDEQFDGETNTTRNTTSRNRNGQKKKKKRPIPFQRPRLDNDGRVTSLRIGGTNFRDRNLYCLSKFVSKLEKLKTLVLVNVSTIPKELSLLKNLEKVWIFWNHNSNNNHASYYYFPPIHLSNLKSLHIEGLSTTGGSNSFSFDLPTWMEQSSFPNLQELSLGMSFRDIDDSTITDNEQSSYSYQDLERILHAVYLNDCGRGPKRLEVVDSDGICKNFDKLVCETIPNSAPSIQELCIAPAYDGGGGSSSTSSLFSLKPLADRLLTLRNQQRSTDKVVSPNFLEWSQGVHTIDITYTRGVLDLYVPTSEVETDENENDEDEDDPQNDGGEGGGGAIVGDENVTSDAAAAVVAEDESCDRYRRTTYQIQNDTEKRSMITMLKTFKRLSSFGSILRLGGASYSSPSAAAVAAVQQKLSLDDEIAYWMRINHGGRILLESSPNAIPGMGGAIDCSGDNATTTDSSCSTRSIDNGSSPKIPLSLWPNVLERSMKGPTVCPGSSAPAMIDHNPKEKDGVSTCLYYLLRNGPAFLNAATSGSV